MAMAGAHNVTTIVTMTRATMTTTTRTTKTSGTEDCVEKRRTTMIPALIDIVHDLQSTEMAKKVMMTPK